MEYSEEILNLIDAIKSRWLEDPFADTRIFFSPYLYPYNTIIDWDVWGSLHRN